VNRVAVRISQLPIDVAEVVGCAHSRAAGAVVLFTGTTREWTDGRRTVALDYDCYAEMAEPMLRELEAEAQRRWALVNACIVHRIGHVDPGEISVAIAVSAVHRQEAFAAAQWLIDTIKQQVPIWKQETWADGTSEWIHPGMRPDGTPVSHPPAAREIGP
jgi:molybdopterin synthase catalytic subunit